MKQAFDIPNGNFAAGINAVTRTYSGAEPGLCNNPDPRKGDCDSFHIALTPPPRGGEAYSITRVMVFAQPQSPQTLTTALAQKYGSQPFSSGRGAQVRLNWAWDASGRPIQLHERHLCAQTWAGYSVVNNNSELMDRLGRFSASDQRVAAGCAITAQATIQAPNGGAVRLHVNLTDNLRAAQLKRDTTSYLQGAVARIEGETRSRSQSTAPPRM
jgi:hypothetical protein